MSTATLQEVWAAAGRGRCGAAASVSLALVSVLQQSVDVVLGAVLTGGHLEHVSDAEQDLESVSVGDHLTQRERQTFTQSFSNISGGKCEYQGFISYFLCNNVD